MGQLLSRHIEFYRSVVYTIKEFPTVLPYTVTNPIYHLGLIGKNFLHRIRQHHFIAKYDFRRREFLKQGIYKIYPRRICNGI